MQLPMKLPEVEKTGKSLRSLSRGDISVVAEELSRTGIKLRFSGRDRDDNQPPLCKVQNNPPERDPPGNYGATMQLYPSGRAVEGYDKRRCA
ncbi:hypothetical protein GF386_01710 [Candidatus Pacearchaeota archaeon]|nr:hypothetical protein [Candidatus Pacearchaeota archaeon]